MLISRLSLTLLRAGMRHRNDKEAGCKVQGPFSARQALLFLALAVSATTPVAVANVFSNGSFELNTFPATSPKLLGGADVGVGDNEITAWTITSGNVDYCYGTHCGWAAFDGLASIDLSGNEAGTIAQTFNTTAGDTYLVAFELAGNFNAGPVVKHLSVAAASASQQYIFDSSGSGPSNMTWALEDFAFTADSSSTTLSFASEDNTVAGPVIDAVTVTDESTTGVPEPTTLALLGIALLYLRHRASGFGILIQ